MFSFYFGLILTGSRVTKILENVILKIWFAMIHAQKLAIIYVVWSLVCLSGAVPVNVTYGGFESAEFFLNYDRNSAEERAPAFAIKAEIFVRDIEKIDDTEMKWSIHLKVILHWSTSVPPLNLDMPGNGDAFIMIPQSMFKKLWLPNLFFVDGRDMQYSVPFSDKDSVKIRAYKNGDMSLTARIFLNMGCPMTFANFPFDKQLCRFKILHNHNPKDVTLSFVENSRSVHVAKDLHLTNFVFVQMKYNALAPTDDGHTNETSHLAVELEFARETSFYHSRIYIPSIIAILITWLSLFMDPLENATARAIILGIGISIGTFCMALCTVPTLHPTALGRWTTVCQVFLLIAVLEFVVVNRFAVEKKQEERSKSGNETQTTDNGVRMPNLLNLVYDRKWHTTIDILFRINYLLAFLVFNLRYYFTFVKRPDIEI